jgi:hypothetical protein
VVQPLNTDGAEWSNTDLQQDVSEVGWPNASLKVVADTTVGSLVPTVFDAYARIAYPGRGGMSRPIPSKPVARWEDQLASMTEVLSKHENTRQMLVRCLGRQHRIRLHSRFGTDRRNRRLQLFPVEGSDRTRSGHPRWVVTESVVAHRLRVVRSSALRLPGCLYRGQQGYRCGRSALREIGSSLVRVDQIITAAYNQSD